MDNLRKIQTEIQINTSKAKAWEALFTQFGETYRFNPNLVGSHFSGGEQGAVGCERVCELDAKTTVKEKIVAADELNSFRIEVTGGNMPFVNTMIADVKLQSISPKKTKVILEAGFNTKPAFMGFLMKFPFKSRLTDMLIGLKYYLETGKEVSKKTCKPISKTNKQLEVSQNF